MKKRSVSFWVLVVAGIVLLIFYILGQTASLVNYEFAESLGLQDPQEQVGEVGLSIARGFAVGDTFVYIPFLVAGIIGLFRRKLYGIYTMFAALAITLYWPIVNIVYIIEANKTASFNVPDSTMAFYTIILWLIFSYAVWGIWFLYSCREKLVD